MHAIAQTMWLADFSVSCNLICARWMVCLSFMCCRALFFSSVKQYTVCRMFLNIHYDPYHCTVGHRYTVVLLLLLSKIQFFFPPALLDSKAKMLTIFFCSWPWSCDSSSRPVTDWMRLLKVDTMMDWMFHVKLSCIVYLPTISGLSWKCDELRSHVQLFSSSVVQSSVLQFFSRSHW